MTARFARESSIEKIAGSGSTFDLHRAARFLEQISIRMREQQDRLFGMVDHFRGEAGLIVFN